MKKLLMVTLMVILISITSCNDNDVGGAIKVTPAPEPIAESPVNIPVDDFEIYAIIYHEMGAFIYEYYITDKYDFTYGTFDGKIYLKRHYIKKNHVFIEKTDTLILYGTMVIAFKNQSGKDL